MERAPRLRRRLRHGTSSRVVDVQLDKVFHVSPLMGMDQRYRFRLTAPGPTLSIHIQSTATADGTDTFDATLNLRREEITRRNLRGLLARFPAQSARTGALIYTNALKLKLKGAPYHAHPDSPLESQASTPMSPTTPTRTRTVLHRLLEHWIRDGELTLVDRHGSTTVGDALRDGTGVPLRSTVTIHDERAYRALLKGSLGLAESYRDGWWDSDDMVGIVRIAARNIQRGDEYRRRLRPVLGSAAERPRERQAQHDRPLEAADLRALRPRQRPVRPDARRDDDVLLGRLPGPFGHPARGAARASSTASATSSTSARRTICWRSAPAGADWPSTPRDAPAAA